MKKTSLLIILVCVSATAVIGYLAKSKIDTLQRTLGLTKSELALSKKSLEAAQLSITRTSEELGTAHKEIQAQSLQLADATTQQKAALDKVTEQEKTIKDQEKQINDFKSIDLNAPDTEKLVKELKENNAKIETLTTERDRLAAELSAANDKSTGLAKEVTGLQQQAAVNQEQVRHYEQNVARMGLTGRVLAVNANWNFVVLNVGDKDGAAPNAGLVVSRNGQNIARGKITTVESGRSVASIMPASMARGETIQPGDQVVFTRL
jgi:hypothetical protein